MTEKKNVMKIFKIPLFVLAASLLCSCEKLFNPNNDNHSTMDRVYVDPAYAEGLLIKAYTYIPTNDYTYNEIATDDAATNDKFSPHLRMATGGWSALANPENLWDNANRAIMYANQFLEVVDIVPWKYTDPQLNALYVRRLKGEALALRGMFKYYLLRNHGGYGSNGQLLGFPIYNEFISSPEQFATPRSTFAESLKSTYDDLDSALAMLAPNYGNIGSPVDLPPGFTDITDIDKYNTVFGEVTQQRISGRITLAIKARAALLAASPAFNSGNDPLLWENAAKLTADVLAEIGGVAGLDPKGNIFYLKAQVDNANLTAGDKMDIPEMLWRRPIYTNRVREQDNFPPTLYGKGEINPSQNLVDAFPMKNGYPIADAASGYDEANPYAGRDPRLALYIVYDGSKMRNTTIHTGVGAGNDGLDALQNSTRTGYYLKKLLREDVNVNPVSTSDQKHFNTHIRYTELFLNYAEAANEAWGPDGTGTQSYSARAVIAAIRARAGISQPDAYLQSVTGKEAMREMIRNERRLELCFEGFRFWDLRRWNVNLTEPLRGVKISNGNYEYFTVEQRAYNNSYMHYGPIPDREIFKFNLIQNNGW